MFAIVWVHDSDFFLRLSPFSARVDYMQTCQSDLRRYCSSNNAAVFDVLKISEFRFVSLFWGASLARILVNLRISF